MKTKDFKLNLYKTNKMFDFAKLSEEEPELFNELCDDYPLDEQIILLEIIKEND